jgi:hypothetical protein
MGEIKIRKLEDWVVEAHKARAAMAGRSLEEELRLVVTRAAEPSKDDLMARVTEHQRYMREKYGVLPDSTPLIREDRDRRG